MRRVGLSVAGRYKSKLNLPDKFQFRSLIREFIEIHSVLLGPKHANIQKNKRIQPPNNILFILCTWCKQDITYRRIRYSDAIAIKIDRFIKQ
jgi:hypothetical protein